MNPLLKKIVVMGSIAVVIVIAGVIAWTTLRPSGPGSGFVSGNGRIEATEIDVATKLAGRVQYILANEGDFVQAGQLLAEMQINALEAQRDEARAQSRHAVNAVASAEAQVVVRMSETAAAQAAVGQRESELDAAQRRLTRTETMAKNGLTPIQELDDDRARMRGAQAALTGAQAQVAASQAAIKAAQAEVVGASSNVAATEATIARVQADIEDGHITTLMQRA